MFPKRWIFLLAIIAVLALALPRTTKEPPPPGAPSVIQGDAPTITFDVRPDLLLHHPLGDRGPEIAAKKILESLPTETCFSMLKPVYEEGAHRVCEYERQFPGTEFELMIRSDAPNKTTLLYEAKRKEFPGRLEFHIFKRGSEWRVEDVNAKY